MQTAASCTAWCLSSTCSITFTATTFLLHRPMSQQIFCKQERMVHCILFWSYQGYDPGLCCSSQISGHHGALHICGVCTFEAGNAISLGSIAFKQHVQDLSAACASRRGCRRVCSKYIYNTDDLLRGGTSDSLRVLQQMTFIYCSRNSLTYGLEYVNSGQRILLWRRHGCILCLNTM